MALEAQLIHDLLYDAVSTAPDVPAIRDATGVWSYRELSEASHAFARWLRARGLRPGDRLVVRLPSRRELVAMFYGASRCGVVFVPLNPAMKTFHLSSVLANAEPALVVGEGEGLGSLRAATEAPVRDAREIWAEVAGTAGQGRGADADDDVDVRPDDLAVLIYTSGSTSAPKAVMCAHAQVVFATAAMQAELGYRPDDVVFCRFPISWDYGLYKVLMSAVGRCELVLAGEEGDLTLLRRMREVGATIVPIVPSFAAMVVTMAGRDGAAPPPVRMFTNTGAALPAATIDALRDRFPGARVVRQFGLTECKRISIMPPEQDRERPGSVGRPLRGTTVEILGPDGAPVPAGEVGEIVVSGPHVMPGYWRLPELTARTFRPDPRTGTPRLHTGDYGSVDEDGYLYFEGRRDDVFKRKGIRMSTLEIEAAAMDLPGVRGAAALPPGEGRDLAIVVAGDLAPREVLRGLAERLEPAKVPGICKVVDELPLTQHGKNARDALAGLLTAGTR
ncbi:AMP-binding protein [Actinomadura rudentiformis]|uniref:AMP-binding protein n=1 Tax=Actinomadura rudentiformis TaxID=359158 RepID=A0A6H9YVF6_9ACTN|nr:AMP-binding protein [Actinomadura rudentiformis]KAB2346140.1 AMP-binding protein [Actinomadura rudentiformis]